ncbi:MAG TPA: hypothetical protein VJ767_05330 [Nitrososphaeraceae archaeon]|nr:hypothetical protein [Nitrososphaeraceae archaeon]
MSTDINKNKQESKKDTSTKLSTDINKNKQESKKDRHKGRMIHFRIPSEDYEYYSTMLSLFNSLTLNNKPVFGKFLSMPALCKITLQFFCNTYRDNLFTDHKLVKKVPNKDTLRNLMAFRSKYLNYPVDKQIVDLEKMGVLTKKIHMEKSKNNKLMKDNRSTQKLRESDNY